MNLSSDIAKAKAAVSSLEAKAIADAKSVGTLINERLKDRRLWAGLLGIILLIVIALVPTKVELAILDRILGLIALLIVCWTAHGMLRDFVNGWVAVSRNMGLSSEGKLDPADGEPAYRGGFRRSGSRCRRSGGRCRPWRRSGGRRKYLTRRITWPTRNLGAFPRGSLFCDVKHLYRFTRHAKNGLRRGPSRGIHCDPGPNGSPVSLDNGECHARHLPFP